MIKKRIYSHSFWLMQGDKRDYMRFLTEMQLEQSMDYLFATEEDPVDGKV